MSNLLKLKIHGIKYNFNGTKTTCTLYYENPLTGSIMKARGSARRNPADEHNYPLAKHIAESRAKFNMYFSYYYHFLSVCDDVQNKYNKLVMTEKKHIKELIHDNK